MAHWTLIEVTASDSSEGAETSSGTSTTDLIQADGSSEDGEVLNRIYNALDKEQRKTKPNDAVINKYLNLEFDARRKMVRETKQEDRPQKIMELYPCFKNPNEVIKFTPEMWAILFFTLSDVKQFFLSMKEYTWLPVNKNICQLSLVNPLTGNKPESAYLS